MFTIQLACLTAIATAKNASDRVVSGTIKDPSGSTVSGAAVVVNCGAVSHATTSGMDGTFMVRDLPLTRCGVRVESQSLAPRRVSVDLARGNAALNIVLDLRGLRTFVAVTPSRSIEESVARIPAKTSVVERSDIRVRASQHMAQALAEEPGIVVQQTTAAAAAPLIRGLIGYQNVAIVDGVRLNTSAWRSGPVQYMAWYDESLVDQIEVVRGPGSVLYGSDALGGTVHVRSVQPSFSTSGPHVSGTADLKASTADTGRGADALIHVSGRRAALIAGGGYDRVGDILAGDGLDSHAAVTRFLGLPSTVLGTERLSKSGYEQRFGHVTAAFGLAGSSRIDATYHYDEQTGASRYDRISGGDGLFRSEFGPQRLDIGHVRYERGRTQFFDAVSAAFSFNRQADGRLEQARPTANIDAQQNTTTSFGYQAQGLRTVGRHSLAVGGELYDDYIGGWRRITTPAGVTTASRPDIPDDTRYTSLGIYAQDIVDVIPDRFSLRGGLRYGRFGFSTAAAPSLGVMDESVTADAVTFQAGAVVNATDRLSLSVAGGRGFRAANASDLGVIGVTSVFEVTPSRALALGGLVGTTEGAAAVSTGRPIEPLRPEELYSFEAGIRYQSPRLTVSISGYTTEMRDAIQRRTVIFPSNVSGATIGGYEVVRQDSEGRAFIASNSAPIVARVNVAKAHLRGFEADARVRIARDWLASTFLSFGRGTDLDANVPLRRVPPGLGGMRLRWQRDQSSVWIEGLGTFMSQYDRMAPGDLTDPRMGARRTTQSIGSYFSGTATDLGLVKDGRLVATGETLAQVQQRVLGGAASSELFPSMPGWFVTTVRGGFAIAKNVDIIVVGENLTDVNYRNLGSGVDSPGRHVRVNTRLSF